MDNTTKEAGYVIFLLISLLTFVSEAALNCISAVYVYQEFGTAALVILLCLIAVPSTILQIISYVFQRRSGHPQRKWLMEALVISVHILQLGLPWRYGRMLLSHYITMDAKEIRDSFILRVFYTFASTLPIIFLQVYLMLLKLNDFSADKEWYLISACAVSLVSVSWCLATYQKRRQYCCAIGVTPSWTATLIRFLWRFGEIVSRILTLALFALAHRFWIFLVLGFHWLTMLLLLFVDQVLQNTENENKLKSGLSLMLKSYIYIFAHLNLTAKKSKYGFVFFYIISCLESIALLILWIVFDKRTEFHMPFGITVAGGYVIALIFALIYYNCFHAKGSKHEHSLSQRRNSSCVHQCAECRLDSIPKARPIEVDQNKPWLQVSACPNPNFFSDTLPSDCTSDRSSDILVSQSHPHIHTNGSLGVAKPKHLLRLDARVLQSGRCKCGSDISSERSGIQKKGRPMIGVPNLALDWDRYDIQVRETPEGASNPETQSKESPRSNNTSSNGRNSKQNSFDGSVSKELDTTRATSGTLDQGYFSTLSSSSKDTHKKLPKKPHQLPIITNQGITLDKVGGHRSIPRLSAGLLSDETASSSFSTTSSRIPILNCQRCGHCVSIDSVSMYSMTSTNTSMTSYPNKLHHYGSMDYLDPANKCLREQRKANKRLSASVTQGKRPLPRRCGPALADLQRPIAAQEPHRSGYAHNNPIRLLSSDVSSAGWEYTDSEM